MANLVELNAGDLLLIRRANPNEPFEGEIESLAALATDLGLTGVVVLGPDDTLDVISDEDLAAAGLQRVVNDRAPSS